MCCSPGSSRRQAASHTPVSWPTGSSPRSACTPPARATLQVAPEWRAAIAPGNRCPPSNSPWESARATSGAPPQTWCAGTREGWSITGYGYGWQIGTVVGRRAYLHTGDNSGYLAVNVWLPDEQVALAVLANDEATNILHVAADLLQMAI